MINTFKAVAIKQYRMSKMEWNKIGKKYTNLKVDKSDVVHGKYRINVIGNKEMNLYGKLQTRVVNI